MQRAIYFFRWHLKNVEAVRFSQIVQSNFLECLVHYRGHWSICDNVSGVLLDFWMLCDLQGSG